MFATVFKRLSVLLAPVFILSACSTVDVSDTTDETPSAQTPTTRAQVSFTQRTWADTPALEVSNWPKALEALKQSCPRMTAKKEWTTVCQSAQMTPSSQAQSFFRSHFTPWQVSASTLPTGAGLMTGYYEPLLRGSRVRHGAYQYPLYSVPDDLIIVDLASLYPQLKGMRLRGKLEGRKLVPYDSRKEIDTRKDLNSKAIVWVDDEIAAFFLQIQGSGRIRLPDGSMVRVGYADQNGHRYQSVGTWLIQQGELKSHEASMQGIQAWARRNPGRVKTMLEQNPSYVFFEERQGDPNLGPLGAQGVPLTPEASVAVDRSYWQLGTIFLVDVTQPNPSLHMTKTVIAQDTGGAIRGPIRFDYFWGFGDDAGAKAGRQKSAARAWVLMPNGYTPTSTLTQH